MKFVKTYENFQIGNDVWVIMTEDEKYIYSDEAFLKLDLARRTMFKILRPIDEVDLDGFKEYGYSAEKKALSQLDWLQSRADLGEVKIAFEKSGSEHEYPFKVDYARWFTLGENERLKVVKFFMGVMKQDKDYTII